MGACMSSGGIEVTEEDKRRNREVEKNLREVRVADSLTSITHSEHVASLRRR